ncbi:hypothetical protein F5Y16DRAFT_197814 [Xylariaceae sp. FL0255]|nr:hypothetical protein F5Y16DRAFT_197814 [Xylariaceae sp. FL0255]
MASYASLCDARESLARAKTLYSEQRFLQAASFFEKVAELCECGVTVRTTNCPCKRPIRDAIEKQELELELRKKCICSAKTNTRCQRSIHLEALDGLAATYEARGITLKSAMFVAETMIQLDPRHPKGYLRLGKLFRLEGSQQTAYLTYCQGIKLVEKKHPDHALLLTLREMRTRLLKIDPLLKLPTELSIMILGYIDFRTICRSTRVSKSWREFLTSPSAAIQAFWRVQNFTLCTKPVSLAQLKLYWHRSGNTPTETKPTEIYIKDCKGFGLDLPKIAGIVMAHRGLKALAMCNQDGNLLDLPGRASAYPVEVVPLLPQLSKLHLGCNIKLPAGLVQGLLESSAHTLKELTSLHPDTFSGFARLHQIPVLGTRPFLLSLTTLRLSGAKSSMTLDIGLLMDCIPNVQELWLDGMALFAEDPAHPNTGWQGLKRLFIGAQLEYEQDLPFPFRLRNGLEELHIDHPRAVRSMVADRWNEDVHPTLNRLVKLSLRYIIPDEPWLKRFLHPSLRSGTMKELELRPFPLNHSDWLKSEQMTHLGLYCETNHLPAHRCEGAVMDMISGFPNLKTIDIGQEPLTNASVGKLVQGGIGKVYYSRRHWDLDDARRWAQKEHNADIIVGKYLDTTWVAPPAESA